MASRRGLGKVRHVEVSQLWVQEKVGSGEIELRKADGSMNLVDALTKHVDHECMSKHMSNTNQLVVEGRHALMPRVAGA